MGKVEAIQYNSAFFRDLMERLRKNDDLITELDLSKLTINGELPSIEHLKLLSEALKNNSQVTKIQLPADFQFSLEIALKSIAKGNETDKKNLNERFGDLLSGVNTVQGLQKKKEEIESVLSEVRPIQNINNKIKEFVSKKQKEKNNQQEISQLIESLDGKVQKVYGEERLSSFIQMMLNNVLRERNGLEERTDIIIEEFDKIIEPYKKGEGEGNKQICENLEKLRQAIIQDITSKFGRRASYSHDLEIKKLESEKQRILNEIATRGHDKELNQIGQLEEQSTFITKLIEDTVEQEISQIHARVDRNHDKLEQEKREINAKVFDEAIGKLISYLHEKSEAQMPKPVKQQSRRSILHSFSEFVSSESTKEQDIALQVIQGLIQCYTEVVYTERDLLKVPAQDIISDLVRDKKIDFNPDKLQQILKTIEEVVEKKGNIKEPLKEILKNCQKSMNELLAQQLGKNAEIRPKNRL